MLCEDLLLCMSLPTDCCCPQPPKIFRPASPAPPRPPGAPAGGPGGGGPRGRKTGEEGGKTRGGNLGRCTRVVCTNAARSPVRWVKRIAGLAFLQPPSPPLAFCPRLHFEVRPHFPHLHHHSVPRVNCGLFAANTRNQPLPD